MVMMTDTSVSSLRPISGEVSLLSQPDGSAMLCQGDTCTMAAVYGPVEVKISKELIDKASVEVIYKPKVGLPSHGDKFKERLVCDTCNAAIIGALHPRTAINIVIQEMQSSGGLLACSINSACLSLLDACVPLKFMLAAVECVIDQDDKMLLDPTKKLAVSSKAQMTFTFENIGNNLVSCVATGCYTNKQYQECLLACREASKDIFQFYRDTIVKKVKSSNKD